MGNSENPNQGVRKADPSRKDQEKSTPGQHEKSDPRQGQSGRPSQEFPADKKSKGSKPSGQSDDTDDERDSE